MISAKEARNIAKQARQLEMTDAGLAKVANDQKACDKYVEMLGEMILDAARKGQSELTYYVPYDNYFNEEVGDMIATALEDEVENYVVEISYGDVTVGTTITIKWE